jgi:hypothetical protein
VGGRFTQFLHHWKKFTTDMWVLSVIRGGLDLVFQERPPLSDSPIPMSQTSDKEKFRLLSEEVQSLLLSQVSFPQFSWEPRRDENKSLVSTESEEFLLLLFSVIEIELPRTEDGTSPCLRSEQGGFKGAKKPGSRK